MIDWAPHAERLQRAIDRTNDGYWTLGKIQQGIEARELQFWPGRCSTGVTECLQDDTGLTVHILFAGGEMSELLQMLDAVHEFAAGIGACRVSLCGRVGWGRVLLRYGYRNDNGVFLREV